MRLALLTFLFATAISGFVHAMPSGQYRGFGNAVLRNGERFGYAARYVIDDVHKRVEIQYGTPGEGPFLQFDYKDVGKFRFEIAVDGKSAGVGFCLMLTCHFDVEFVDRRGGKNKISSTLMWVKDQLIVNGQSFGEGFVYEDILNRVP